jgi:hypothetical protein
MKHMIRLIVSLLVPAFMLAGVAATSAMAQDKAKAEKGKATLTVLLDNDNVRAFEVRYEPGDENASVPISSFRVVRALKGGTLQRIYADGKTEKVEWKTGEVRLNEPSKVAYNTKYIGKSELLLYVVVLKQAK